MYISVVCMCVHFKKHVDIQCDKLKLQIVSVLRRGMHS